MRLNSVVSSVLAFIVGINVSLIPVKSDVPGRRNRGITYSSKAGRAQSICGQIVKTIHPDPPKTPIRFDPKKPWRPPLVAIDVLTDVRRNVVRRFPVNGKVTEYETDAQGKTTKSQSSSPGVSGSGYYRQYARITLNDKGVASEVRYAPTGWRAVLKHVTTRTITVSGYRVVPSHRQGTFDDWAPEFYTSRDSFEAYGKPKSVRISTSDATVFRFNRDTIKRSSLDAHIGHVVDIILDCSGRAAYVDAYRISGVLNSTGGNRPLSYSPDGRLVVNYSREHSRVRTPKDVKIYNSDGYRIPEAKSWEGFVGVWGRDPTKEITHVFLAGE
jgi:hypothetical protein